MKHLMLTGLLLALSISCYAQESQESYTLLMLDFEDRSGIDNPLLAAFNETIAFLLSRQTGPVEVRLISNADRDALLARAAAEQPDATLSEQGLLAAEWVDADALVVGSYTKQGGQWSLEAQVYHRREESKTRQQIQIQDNSLYQVLDDFPAHLLRQFSISYAAPTTNSWKAYEEFRKGHEAFEGYNFFGALGYYDKALALDPTLALVYAEKSYVHSMMGQREQATIAIEAALELMSRTSPVEQAAIRALVSTWDSERNEPRELYDLWELYGEKCLMSPSFTWPSPINLTSGGVWDEPLIHQLAAFDSIREGKPTEADQHHAQWFKAIQSSIQARPADALLLHRTATYCLGIGKYVDEAIEMEIKAIELNLEAKWRDERYVLSRLYELKGDMEQSLEWAKKHIQYWPDPNSFPQNQLSTLLHGEGASLNLLGEHIFVWSHLARSMHEESTSPERLLRWCEDVLRISGLNQVFRVHTQYLMAEIHHTMDNEAKMEAALTIIGAPLERDWMVIGPLETSNEALFPETPPFASLFTDLTATHEGISGEEMQWQPWEDEQPMDGLLDIWGIFNKKYYGKSIVFNFPTPVIAYSCIYVKVPTAMDVQVRTGSGTMRAWLNDNPLPIIDVGNNGRIPDRKLSDVSLIAGFNRFLVATVSAHSYGFYFRITDEGGNPIPGLEYVSAKEVLASR